MGVLYSSTRRVPEVIPRYPMTEFDTVPGVVYWALMEVLYRLAENKDNDANGGGAVNHDEGGRGLPGSKPDRQAAGDGRSKDNGSEEKKRISVANLCIEVVRAVREQHFTATEGEKVEAYRFRVQ